MQPGIGVEKNIENQNDRLQIIRGRENQERLALIASETLDYQGLSQVIEEEVVR